VVAGTPKNITSYSTAPPKAEFFSGNYQQQYYRYYDKVDKLLGIIGGGIFLLYLIFYLPCHYLNCTYYRMSAAEELLI
jgi:hypothetical protein